MNDRGDYDSWWHVDAIFAEASGLVGDERSDFLRDACGGDDALRERVERLLNAHDASEEYLEDPANWIDLPPMPGLDNEPGRSRMEGDSVGPYRLLNEIGRGGMGAVYLAERADGQFTQRVALKLIRGGFVTEQAVRRFRLEREILARLQHPNIARLIDGNITEEGWPYFVMEYVPGRPITTYCDDNDLDVPARLDLFRVACGAVHYAHQNLIIHRDLTPNNILVTPDVEVKLLDFGIAKLLDDDSGGITVPVTEEGLRLLTPEYASPEQIRGEPVTTAGDVYQLGILLYELLTGDRPFKLSSRVLHEVARVICEEEPEKPSTRVARIEGGSRAGPNVDRLRRSLTGDLDNVVLMAIRKEPDRRYSSAEQLADDVNRHVRGFTVRARPETVAYRVSKFVRRHRLGVAAGVLIAASMLGGLSVAVWQARIAASERDAAKLEAAKAGQVTEFLVGVFEGADPETSRGDTLNAYEILDRGTRRIKSELSGQPEIRASLLDVIGRAYQHLGDFGRARSYLTEALDIRRESGAGTTQITRSVIHLTELLNELGEREAADSLLQVGLSMAAETPDLTSERADLIELSATLSAHKADFEAADSLFRVALALQESVYGSTHPEIATTHNDLGLIAHVTGNAEVAEEHYRKSLSIREAAQGRTHPQYAVTLSNVGWLLMSQGDLLSADSALSEVLRIRRTLYGDDHPYVARSRVALAEIRIKQHRYSEARDDLESAIAIFQQVYDPDHSRLLRALNTLATVVESSGDADEAVRIRRSVLNTISGDELLRALVLNDLAMTYSRAGDLAAAEQFLLESLALYEKLYGESHPNTERVRGNLESLLSGRNIGG